MSTRKLTSIVILVTLLFIPLINFRKVFAAASGLFGPYETYASGSPHAVGAGDFNHDNRMDVALTNSAAELKVFLQNASGDLNPAVTYASGTRPEALAVGDLNHDGWDDIVTTNFNSNTISVFIQQADGTLAARTTYTTGTGPYAVAVGDVNGDLKDDVVVSNWNSSYISVFIQNAGNTLNSKVDYTSPQAGYDDIAIGDVNGDGYNDVVKMNGQSYANPDLSVYIQSGGVLQSAVSYSLTGNKLGTGIGIGDVTGDGRADVVMSYGGNAPSSFVAVFAQSANGSSLLAPVSYAAYDVPEALEVADVNEDGKKDVIVAHGGWDNVSVYLQEDGGGLGQYSLYALPNNSGSHYKPQGLEIADTNGDLLPDILVANSNFGLNLLPHLEPDITAPTLLSITRTSVSLTSSTSVSFMVTFSEAVTGVSNTAPFSDFLLTTTGVTGASITNVSGSGSMYTVTVNTGSGNGTIRLDVPNSATIKDLSNNDLSNLPFEIGEVYTVQKNSVPLPTGWVGSVSITSNKNLVTVGRPHIDTEVASYDGFSAGSTTTFVPMLFKDAFGGSYDAALYIQNLSNSLATLTIQFINSSGVIDCTLNDTINARASKGYWLPSINACSSGSLPADWVGGVKIASDQPIAAVGRPHIGSEITTYNGFSTGSTSVYVPMLFKGSFGGSYNAAFYVQNVDANNTANITIQYFDTAGTLNCIKQDILEPLASKGYWVPTATCDSSQLPVGWYGGVKITSDQPIVAVGRPHIDAQVMTYNGFAGGSTSTFVPMLFKNAYGGSYDAAFYVQNVASISAAITLKYYDSAGNLNCTKSDTLWPLSSKGYWVPTTTCDSGSLPIGWVGGVEVTSDQPTVAVGRPHIDTQVMTYNGFSAGAQEAFLPMLFKDAFGGPYDAAFYLQNTEGSAATVTVRFYDSTGAFTCSRVDTIPPRATFGFWLPSLTCYP